MSCLTTEWFTELQMNPGAPTVYLCFRVPLLLAVSSI